MPPPTDTVPELTLRALRNGDGVTGISLGDTQFSPLKTLLKRDVTIFHEELLARTYVLVDSGNAVRGFVTLVCGEITTDNSLDETVGVTFRYEHYPAVKIARLAVDHRYRGYGYGRNPVDFATGCIRNISEIAGCRFVVVDVKKPSINFYRTCGFRLINTEENRNRDQPVMFMDLLK